MIKMEVFDSECFEKMDKMKKEYTEFMKHREFKQVVVMDDKLIVFYEGKEEK